VRGIHQSIIQIKLSSPVTLYKKV